MNKPEPTTITINTQDLPRLENYPPVTININIEPILLDQLQEQLNLRQNHENSYLNSETHTFDKNIDGDNQSKQD
jgi:hypothetical protein